MICIWSSWSHCHLIISCLIKIQNGLSFLLPAYQGCPRNAHTQPFYGPFSGTTRVSWCQKKKLLLDFMVQGKINRGRHTDHPAGRHSIRTNQRPTSLIPHFYAGCPSCCNSSNLSWLWTGTKYSGLHSHGLVHVVIEKRPLKGCLSEVISMSEEWPHPLLRLKYSCHFCPLNITFEYWFASFSVNFV